MEQPLAYLQQRADDDWLIGCDSYQFVQMAEQLYLELTQRWRYENPPKILLSERDPVRFLAGFIAACAAGCPVFLGNPNWVEQEWQQVFAIMQPNLILGYGNWGSAVRDYYPNHALPDSTALLSLAFQPPILNPQWIMIPTGGSSGKIRFAMHTWETLMASVNGFRQYFQLNQINSCCVLPLYHVSGLMQFLRSFTTGGQLAILGSRERGAGSRGDKDLFAQVKSLECFELGKFFISLVPTQLQRLLHNQENASLLSQFHTVLLGGAPAWIELLEVARHHGIRLAPTYGMTETASQIATLKPEDFLSGKLSCGQILPHVKATICSPTGQPLGANEIGNITIQADSLALGYYPELFANRHIQLDDLGFFDFQGHLNIVGRNSHKIITGGENVYPAEVEAAIRATQMVSDVCVIGICDRYWGQVVTAIYTPSNPAITPTAIQTALQDKLCKFKQPKYWISLKSLPRNSSGKINHEQLHLLATTSLQNSPK